MQCWPVNVAPNGRLSLPIDLRRLMGVAEGGRIDIEVSEDGTVRLLSIADRVKRAQALSRQMLAGEPCSVADFIGEKRLAAAEEIAAADALVESGPNDGPG